MKFPDHQRKIISVLVVISLSAGLSGCISIPQEEGSTFVHVHVIRVVDGDTIEVEWENGTQSTVRILGIDTPEVHTDVDTSEWEGIDNETWLRKCGHKASNFTRRWISDEVNLTFDENEGKRGYYGRYLAYVELENGTDLGEELVKHGWARVYTEGDCVREDQYLGYEEDAQEGDKGVWERS